MMNQSVRRNHSPIKVHCLPEEKVRIEALAKSCGLSTAAYLRALGLNHEPKSALDHQMALELCKLGADMGRVGGLLKMWLSNDDRMKSMGKDKVKPIIEAALNDIKTNQALMLEAIKKL